MAALGAGDAVTSATPSQSTMSTVSTVPATTPGTTIAVDESPADDGGARPVFLEGPSTPPAPIVMDVAVPTTHGLAVITGQATYARTTTSDRCELRHAPTNARLVILNVNNGRSVTCRNVSPVLGGDDRVVVSLDEALFLQIADLVDAPVPVRISW